MTTARRSTSVRRAKERPAPRLRIVETRVAGRSDRIAGIRRRIRAGYYERLDIKESLARAVIEALRDED
jgi:hypothetical protein